MIDKREFSSLHRAIRGTAWLWLMGATLAGAARAEAKPRIGEASASSVAAGSTAAGAIDGQRFACDGAAAWRGKEGDKAWWWQVRFPEARPIGAILQIVADHASVFQNAPRQYIWQGSLDGKSWEDLPETRVLQESRLFRLHRLNQVRRVQYLRLRIDKVEGAFPTLREVEFFADPNAKIAFEPWAVLLDTTGNDQMPGHAGDFLPLAKSCRGWEALEAQHVWLGGFDEAFLQVEPRPLCAFLSGNFIDWCQQKRGNWRGVEEVLRKGHLPMWASCGGAQGLAILAETGAGKPWDCPHCRDPKNPRTPIYTHIGHTAVRPCGDYSACRFERGPHNILQLADDPVFTGLPREFRSMESHCGQIEWPPKGWLLLATAGAGSLTKTQCLRRQDRPIYAAQFHIEMNGTPESSRQIMSNFLKLAHSWGGYNPQAKPLAPPTPWKVR
jgi:hypothetical protein